MPNYEPPPSVDRLLAPPERFHREYPKSYLFVMYSRKLRRRLYAYRPRGYDLAVRLECDTSVKRFNMLVCRLPISLSGGAAATNTRPAAVSLSIDRVMTVHTFAQAGNDVDSAEPEPVVGVWDEWCDTYGYKHVQWTKEALYDKPILHRNRKQLLRFVTRAGRLPDPVSMETVLAELRTVRRTTLYALLRRLPMQDPELIQAATAALILDGKVYSTIESLPFQMSTELSAFHAFEEG